MVNPECVRGSVVVAARKSGGHFLEALMEAGSAKEVR